MKNGMDLTLKLGLPNLTVETHLSFNTPANSPDQGTNVDGSNGGNNEGGSFRPQLLGEGVVIDDHNVDANIRVYNYVFNYFAGTGETLNFAPFPRSLSPTRAPTPTPVIPVLIDVPAMRACRNSSLAKANSSGSSSSGGLSGGKIKEGRKCTNLNCNTLSTPLWRRGPLGPKSLCNACGIKFRKDEDRIFKRN